MAVPQFKLTQPGGFTRRIHFPGSELPSWFALASKIQSLYDIPIDKVGVAYQDSDGDEVTLSSEDELQDFYATNKQPETIKFTVQDLRSLRDSHLSSKAGSMTPQNINYRNTFGGEDAVPMAYEVEDEWQRLPHALGGLFGRSTSDSDGFYGAPSSPHAFIEVLDSDVNSVVRDAGKSVDTTMESDLLSSLTTPVMGKGKEIARAEVQPSVTDDISSTGSVLVAEKPVKFPVHVLDVGDEGMAEPVLVESSPAHPIVDSPRSTTMPIQAESTPIAVQPSLPAEEEVKPESVRAEAEELVADPPLPTLDSEQAPPSVSLTSDVAAFLTSLSSVFSSHPELSEGLRNITRNATNGTYWAVHREAVSRAAEELRRSATEEGNRAAGELRQAAEEEAGRRVADALGGLMRLFGDMTGSGQGNGERGLHGSSSPNGGNDASTQPTTVDYGDLNSTNFVPPVAGNGAPLGRPLSWGGHETFPPPPGAPPPPGPPPPPGHLPHRPYGPFRPVPPPPPPPPHFQDHHGPFGPPLGPPHRAHWGSPFWARPPPPAGRRGPPPFSTPWGATGPNDTSTPTDAVGPWTSPSSNETPSPAELRAKVEVAKQNYKREKETYRRAREQRKAAEQKLGTSGERYVSSVQLCMMTLLLIISGRHTQDGAKNGDGGAQSAPVPAPVSHIVSNARGPYPKLEMVSVPHNHRRNASTAADTDAHYTRRITRRLADVNICIHCLIRSFTDVVFFRWVLLRTHIPLCHPESKTFSMSTNQ